MATLNGPGVNPASAQQRDTVHAHVYGNVAYKSRKITLPASGAGSAVADLINFFVLPLGAKIIDFFESHNGANGAATTANFGLAAITGGPTTFVDADYFLAAADLNAAGRNRWGNTAVYSVTLDGPYVVQAVLAAAAVTVAMDVEVTVLYEFVGNK